MPHTRLTAWALVVCSLIAVTTAPAETVHPDHGPTLASQAQALAAPPLPPPPPPPPECREPEVPKLTVIDTTSSRIRLRATVQICEEVLSLERQHGDQWQQVGQGQYVDPLSPFPFEVTDTDRQPSTTYCYRAVGTIGDQIAMSTTECGTTDAAQPEVPMVFAANASVISEYDYRVDRDNVDQPVTFLTTDLSPGSDPVLHLLDASRQEVAVADTGGPGFAARLTYIPRAEGTYRLVVRARSNTTGGTCNLTKNGVVWQSEVVFGGWHASLPALRAHESLETVKLPNGATGRHLLFVLKADGLGIALRDYGNGTGGAAALKLTVPLGDRTVMVGVNAWGTPGAVRLIRNDAGIPGHDVDQDKLGSELEKALHTCRTRNEFVISNGVAFDCPDPRDTDQDGIPDGWEVLGRRGRNLQPDQPDQPLPLWGADPLRADLFIEVDRITQQPDRVNDAILVPLREIFLDLPQWLNPDGSHGIAVHVDAGGPCSDPTLCGDWGGSETYDHDCDALPSKGTVLDHFAPVRHGIFHYTLRTCDAQSSGDYGTITRIAPDNTENEAERWAHELGHNLGLGHHGDNRRPKNSRLNSKVAYPSLMDYVYQNSLPPSGRSRFSEGRLDPLDVTSQSEQSYSPGRPKAHMSHGPYHYTLVGDAVDFNRDGRISPFPVMHDYTPLNYAVTGEWPEIHQYRAVSARVPSGGPGIAVHGTTSRIFVVAPFAHPNGIYSEITWTTDSVAGETSTFGPWRPSAPLGGGFDPNGEVGAVHGWHDDEPSVFVTLPGNDGKLYYSWFKAQTNVWSPWAVIPGWPAGTRAHQASVALIRGAIWVVYRDMHAAEGVPNTWVNTLDYGSWQGWEQLPIPSYLTPGIAEASDGHVYLLYAVYAQASGGQIRLGLRMARRPLWGGTFTTVNELNFVDEGLSTQPIPTAKRTRLQLEFLPYRMADGTVFSDQSGYLAAYWTAGEASNQRSWLLKRAYTPGYIAPGGPCFGATPTTSGCGNTVLVRWRAQKMRDRPQWGMSAQIAIRWKGVSAVFVESTWNPDKPAAQVPQGIAYQPWASGTPVDAASRHDDNNDAWTMRHFMCHSLRALEGDIDKCDYQGP
jgi:hypothetical protein